MNKVYTNIDFSLFSYLIKLLYTILFILFDLFVEIRNCNNNISDIILKTYCSVTLGQFA